jgi:hypothetical protein
VDLHGAVGQTFAKRISCLDDQAFVEIPNAVAVEYGKPKLSEMRQA